MSQSKAAHFTPEAEVCSAKSMAVWAVSLFVLVTLTAQESVTMLAVLLGLALPLVLVLERKRGLGQRLNLPFLLTALYVAWAGISCFYASSATLALKEFTKILVGFCLFSLIVLLSKRGKSAGRNAACAVSAVSAVFSFLSIDLVSTGWFSGAFRTAVEWFTSDFSTTTGLEAGTRITSILADANTFASVAGLGIFLALGLALSSEKRERAFHVVCLYLSALGFVLAFSLGAMGFICVAFVLFLLMNRKGERLRAAILMVETLLLTVAGMLAVYVAVFDGTTTFSLVPLVTMLLGSAGLVLLDKTLTVRLTALLSGHKKLSLAVLAALILCAGGYAVAAVSLTGPAALAPGEALSRAADLPAGDYTTASAGAEAMVLVTSQNETELILHTNTQLYHGPVGGAAFTVSEGAEIVWFYIYSPTGGTLETFTYTGAAAGAVKLDYTLLPGFMANRLQGLWANQNAVQRTEFWRDGLHLWQKSPLIGGGLGITEAGLYSVARFQDVAQSRYVHNHYVQVLADTGIIGLVLFVGMLGAGLWLAWRGRQRGAVLAPALLAALGFAALQAINQAAFSLHCFIAPLFCVLAVVNVSCAEAAEVAEVAAVAKGRKRLQMALCWGAAALCVAWSVIILNHLRTESNITLGKGAFFTRLESAIKSDPFSRNDAMLSYIVSGANAEDEAVQNQAGLYAQEYKTPANSEPDYVAEFFFDHGVWQSGMESLSRHVAYNQCRADAWQYAFTLLSEHDDGSTEYRAAAKLLADRLAEANAYLLVPVSLYGRAQAYWDSLN